MKYFKDKNTNEVYAYETQQEREQYGAPDLVALSEEEVFVHLNPPPTPEQLRSALKAKRTESVANIKVTTSLGNTFDGDELSQGRMARAILSMSEEDTILWTLADNTVVSTTRSELQEALRLAGVEQAKLWPITLEE